MGRVVGNTGSVYIGANKAGVKSWTLDDVQNTEEGLSLIHISEPTRPY